MNPAALTELEYLRRRVAELEARLRDATKIGSENYKTIFNLAAVGIAQATISEGEFVAANRRMAEITGYSVEELIGCRFLDITHPDDRATNRELYGDLVAGRIPYYRYEKRYIRKDGTPVWVNSTISLVRDEAGIPTHSIGVIEDIMDRKRAAEALTESLEWQRLTVDAGKIGLWSWDIVNNVVTWSDRIYEFHKVDRGAFSGTVEAFAKLIHPDDVHKVEAAISQALAGNPDYEVEFRAVHPDGAVRWLATSGRVIYDDARRPLRLLGATIDITERKLAETALRRSKADLEQFAYAAAHDLQEPLRMISIYAELLARRYKGKLAIDADRYIKHTTDGAKRMQRLVEDLLAYTRIVHSDDEPVVHTNCEAVFRDALANLTPAIEESAAEITSDPLPYVRCAAVRVLQVFQNLIGNAIKYHGRSAPRIHVSARREGDMWRFAVKDNGIGIHPDYHQRIFGVFKRLHGHEVAGTGIGLAICKRIVEHAGGDIWVESAGEGAGSTFVFTLPAA